MKQILSCVQPTGNLHFGRYFGAVQNWVRLQEEYGCIYGVVDYHAMTMPFKPDKLRLSSWEVAFNMIACGVKKENVFIQSLIPEHAELGWILGCVTSYGMMTRMTQFKDKSQQVNEGGKDQFISTGLFYYPILQAADILIYQADYVPVGKDQEQHLELTRNIAQKFNHVVGKEYFVTPEALFTEIPKVMSTADPMKKMSASMGEKHNIDVFAEPDRIRKQIKSAVTDTGDTPVGTMSPGIENLFSLLKACGAMDSHTGLMNDFEAGALQYVDLKEAVADALITHSDPIRARKTELMADKKQIKYEIKQSSAEIRKKAQSTIKEVKELIGLLNVKF